MLVLMAMSSNAFAYWCNSPIKREYNLPLPSTIAVPRDAVVGTKLTSWIRAPGQSDRFWTCGARREEWVGWNYFRKSGLGADTGLTVDGFAVYKTSLDGIGIAVKAWGRVLRDYSPYTDAIAWSAYSLDSSYGVFKVIGSTADLGYAIGGAVDVMLVKTGPVKAGKISRELALGQSPNGSGDSHYGGGGYDTNYYVPEISVTVATCATPDVAVNLGKHSLSEFPTVGSRSTPVKLTLAINTCPAGLSSVQYGFNFSSGTGYSAKDGLFGLKASSTAKGLQVKLMKDDGKTTVELDKWFTLTSYKASTGGSYTVDMTAAYQRIGTVTEGTADAELVIAMSYN